MQRLSAGRFVVGVLALLALLALAVFLPRWGGLRERAVVEAGRTFQLATDRPGTYTWNLRDGMPARSQGVIQHRMVQFDRSELVELQLSAELTTGSLVAADQELAVFRSPRLVREVDQLRAERDALSAELELLRAGGRDEAVAEARKRLELAEARRAGEAPQLERLRALAGDDLVTAAELEALELQDEIRRLEIELARAQLAVIRSPARPEALAALDAEIAALDARLGELDTLLDEYVIRTPIPGILELGGRRNILRVYDIDTVYLRIPIDQASRYRVDVGDTVVFRTTSCPGEAFEGAIVDLGENAINLNGRQIFWGSAEIANPDHRLRSGMTGDVTMESNGRAPGVFGTVWRELTGAAP